MRAGLEGTSLASVTLSATAQSRRLVASAIATERWASADGAVRSTESRVAHATKGCASTIGTTIVRAHLFFTKLAFISIRTEALTIVANTAVTINLEARPFRTIRTHILASACACGISTTNTMPTAVFRTHFFHAALAGKSLVAGAQATFALTMPATVKWAHLLFASITGKAWLTHASTVNAHALTLAVLRASPVTTIYTSISWEAITRQSLRVARAVVGARHVVAATRTRSNRAVISRP